MPKQQKPNDDEILEQIAPEEEENEMDDVQAELESKLKEADDKIQEYKNMYLRALADYKNLEHRMNQERDRMRNTIQKQCVERFLPVLDNMEQAESFTKDPGLQMVIGSFRQTLKEMGVKEFDLMGKEFDPYVAEVVEAVPGDQDNMIVEVLQKAYELNGDVIRHGRVKVSKVAQ